MKVSFIIQNKKTQFACVIGLLLGGMNYANANSNLFTVMPNTGDLSPAISQSLNQIKLRPTTMSTSLVKINTAALRTKQLSLALPDNKSLKLVGEADSATAANFVWTGTLPDTSGQAILVTQNGKVTGTIRDGVNLYRVESAGSGDTHIVTKIDETKFPPDEPENFNQKQKRIQIKAIVPMDSLPDEEADTPAAKPETSAKKADGGTISVMPRLNTQIARSVAKTQIGTILYLPPKEIDVLVAYTPSAKTAAPDMAGLIALAMAETNLSYKNSRVRIKLNLVDSFQLNYNESGKSYGSIVDDFKANATVQSRRNSSKADMAVLIVNNDAYCGMADTIQATESSAFAAVNYSCATGYYSFGHELGHLQGARHDPDTDSNSTPFAHGHGFRHTGSGSPWRTVMAYNCSGGCPRLPYWSNPNVNYLGIPTGTASTSYNARVLNQTAATVAGFR